MAPINQQVSQLAFVCHLRCPVKTEAHGIVLQGRALTSRPAQVRRDGIGVRAWTPEAVSLGFNPDSPALQPKFRLVCHQFSHLYNEDSSGVNLVRIVRIKGADVCKALTYVKAGYQ